MITGAWDCRATWYRVCDVLAPHTISINHRQQVALGSLCQSNALRIRYIKSELQKGELVDVALSEDKQMVILICMALPVTLLTSILIIFVAFHTVYLPW